MPADAEKIDLSRYVAIGDSITAGYADGALYFDGQKNAYPNILAAQFKTKNGGFFNQAWMPENSVGVNLEGNSKLGLKTESDSKEYMLQRIADQGDQQALYFNTYVSEGPFHNLGVPGAKVINLSMSGYGNQHSGPGNFNPFFTRMASDPQQTSVLKDALLLSPTFFSLFIGNNDALAFALSGGTENSITPLIQFESKLREIVEKLMAHGAQGLIANLPSIKNIPYFTCLPAKGLHLTTTEAQNMTARYIQQGVVFLEGDNCFLMEDTVSRGGLRQLKEDEFILLDLLLDVDCKTYLKGLRPIPKKYTLTVAEIEEIENALAGYNKIIMHLAEEKKLAFADIYTLLKTAKPDRHYLSAACNLYYSNKGVFSLDGLHPNGFGQALIANAFIEAINQKYVANILPVNALRFAGIYLPSHKTMF